MGFKWSSDDRDALITAMRDHNRPNRRGVVVLLLALLGGILFAGVASRAEAQEPWIAEVIAERSAARGVSPWLLRSVLRCESNFTPSAVGDRGMSLGIAQLHREGLLPVFYRLGWRDPFNVYEAIDFLAWGIAKGHGAHWSCYRLAVRGLL